MTIDRTEGLRVHSNDHAVSTWFEGDALDYSPLKYDLNIDVCIVGGGIAGIASAYFLGKMGKSVAILEEGKIGGGATHVTTAHLTWVLDELYYRLIQKHGRDKTIEAAKSHKAAIDTIEKIVLREAIDCDFKRVNGYLISASDKDVEELQKELQALHELGFSEVEGGKMLPFNFFQPSYNLFYPLQAQFHPLKFIRGLCSVIQNNGGQIFTDSPVVDIQEDSTAEIKTKNGCRVRAQAVIVATNSPINDRFAIHTKQAPYQTYVLGFRCPKGKYEHCLIWDSDDPYRYLRFVPKADHDVLLVGGEDHKSGQANNIEERFSHLERWAKARFPAIGAIEYRWSGQVLETVDGLAYIGKNPGRKDNVFVATGTSGNGMTYGMLSGMILSDLAVGKENPWTDLYNPDRISLSSAKRYVKENINVAWQYGDWIKPGDTTSIDDIPSGEGSVIRDGFKMLAVYRDPKGSCHALSAKCPHLGCVVHWNTVAKTWDCPCHGSRFNSYGKVINGPALSNLQPTDTNISSPPPPVLTRLATREES